VAGAATDTRKTASTTRDAARTPELAPSAATTTREAALPAGTATRTHVLAAGTAVAIGVAALPTRVLFEDDMRCRAASRSRARRERFSCRHRRNSNRCSNSATNYQRFDQIQFR
jgi:hypothetical protein